MACVKKRENEEFDSLLKRFKKSVKNDGILDELKRRSYYKAPSLKQKEKSKEAQKRLRRFTKKSRRDEE